MKSGPGKSTHASSRTPFEQFVGACSPSLSPQLRRVFALLVLACDDDTIGFVLRLKRSTVRHYIERVLMTLRVTSRADVPLMYIRERAPELLADLRTLFEPVAYGRLAKTVSRRAQPDAEASQDPS